MSQAVRDQNRVTSLMGVSSTDGTTPLPVLINPATGRILISATIADNTSTQKVIIAKAGTTIGTRDKINFIEGSGVTLTITDSAGDDRVNVTIAAASGSGTVSSVSVVSANGFAGTVATSTTTPAITLTTTVSGILQGDGTAISSAATTGSGNVVLATSPTLTTPVLGVASATTINKVTLTAPATGSTLTILDGKTLTANKSITLEGTDSTTMTFPSTNATVARTDAAQTFTGLQTYSNAVNYTNNAIAASGNAATIPITARVHTVTNNSAATLTITLATASAIDGQLHLIRILDASAAAQTITWVNTENSTVTAPVTSNGSTTLPLTVGFQYNSATSKWRTIASC